jgi:hypothetical protein
MSAPTTSADPEIGRRYVLAAIALMALTSVTTTVLYVARIGTDRLPQQAGRLVILFAVGYFMLQRRQWARWLMVIFLALAVWTGLGVVLRANAFAAGNLRGTLPMLALTVGYGVILRGLLYSASVRAFFGARSPS